MKPGWTAGVTRARLLVNRAIGADHAHAIALCQTLDDGVGALAGSAYGERVRAGHDIAAAERGVADTLLWHLRILAGWLPVAGAGLVRALAGWFELANIDARMAALISDGREPSPFVLGRLATAWPRIDRARTVQELAEAVAGSRWGDPGGRSPADLAMGLRVLWARRVQDAAPEAASWVAGAGALLVARELLVAGTREHELQLRRLPWVSMDALAAQSLDELRGALLPQASWTLAGLSDPSQLWRAELRWWDQVELDALTLLRMREDAAVVLAAVALLSVDAQRTARALRTAAHGGSSDPVETVGGAL